MIINLEIAIPDQMVLLAGTIFYFNTYDRFMSWIHTVEVLGTICRIVVNLAN